MACRYTYQGKTYEAHEFDDVLRAMKPAEASEYMPGVQSLPDAPMIDKTDKWLTLALKRIVTMAAQEGYDRVAFTTGAQQKERFRLSNTLRELEVQGRTDVVTKERSKSLVLHMLDNKTVTLGVGVDGKVDNVRGDMPGGEVVGKPLADVIGKGLAERVLESPSGTKIQGDGLDVGGEGMKAFYDTILPNTLKGVLKKVGGGQMEQVSIETISALDVPFIQKQTGFTITPAMREKASQDLPLFRATQGTKPGGLSKAAVQLVVDDITKNWKRRPNVQVVESASEMPFNAPADTNGAYFKGTVWIVSKAHHNKAKIARTLAHEAIAHYGLRNMLGGEGFRRYMGNIQLGLKAKNKALLAIQADVRKAYVDENGKFNLTPNQEADEIAARAVELAVDENGNFKPGLGFLKSVYARIMEFLRDLGFTFHVTNAELQGMLVLAQRNIEAGSRTSGGGGGMVVAASRTPVLPATSADIRSIAKDALDRLQKMNPHGDFRQFTGEEDFDDNSTPVAFRAAAAIETAKAAGWTVEPDIWAAYYGDESFYILAKKPSKNDPTEFVEAKIRVANHGNTTRAHEGPSVNIAPGYDTVSDIESALNEVYNDPDNADGKAVMFSRFDPSRRQFMMGTAAALASQTAGAGVTIGKAQPVPSAIMGAQVSPEVAKLLRGNGATNPNGSQALRKALDMIATTGPKEVRALAGQISKLLPEKGFMLTVDDRGLWNAHGAVTLSPVPHLQLFTAEGRTGLTYDTLLHESLHVAVAARYRSLSVGMVRSNDALLKIAPPGAAQAMEQFRAVWDEFKTVARPALKDLPAKHALRMSLEEAMRIPDEFFVRALTDPTLQEFMASKAYEGKTLLQRFKDWVKTSLLGLKQEGTAPSWLDAALAATDDLNTAMLVDKADFARLGALNRMQAQRSATDGEPMFSRSVIHGNTDRYSPKLKQAMRDVGFEVELPTLKERAQSLWKDAGKKMAQGLVDQFAPVKTLSQEAYGLLRLSKGASGAFEVLLKGGRLKLTDGAYDFDENAKGGVIDRLLKPLQGEHHDFLRWVAANRAERLMGEGKENLFTQGQIDLFKTLADGTADFDYTIQAGANAGTVTRDRTLIYADALRVFNEFNKNVLDMAEQSGLIDAEGRKNWEHEFYVPFYRVAEESTDGVRGMNIKGSVVRQQAFKMLKGGKDKLNADLLDNTLLNWAHLLDASAKNRAAKATIEAAERIGVAAGGNQSTLKQMAASMGAKNGVVWFMDGGEKRYSLVDDPYILTAISALEYAGMKGPVMTAMGTMKHYLTMGVTASPFFKVRNLIRDSVQAIGVGDLSYNPAKNVGQGWKLTKPGTDSYFRLLAGGGTIHFGTMMEGSEAKRVQALVESGVDKASILDSDQKVKAFYRRVIEPAITAYNELGNRGEAVNRASLYDQLRKQGVSHADASLQARDLMDFSMQGSWATIRFLTQVVPFMNARMQGTYRLGRAAKEDPARFGVVLGAVTVASLALLAAYSDDDDWKRREEWDRNNYWWFKFGGTAYRIPKPFEIGAMATLAERGFELAFDKEMTGKRFRKQVMTLLGDNLSMNPIPQLVKPMLDVYANTDSFSGRPIETRGMERLQSEYRFNDRTSMLARGTSTAMNAVTALVDKEALSPVQIDHMLRGYFGWLGSLVVGTGDVIARPVTGQAKQAQPDYWKVATGGMVSDLRDAPSRYVTQLYEQAREIDKAYATYRDLVKQGKTSEAAEFAKDNPEIRQYAKAGRLTRAEGKINERIRMIERSNLEPERKRELLRELRAQKERVARTG